MKICRSTLILVVVLVMVSLAFASRQSELRRRFEKISPSISSSRPKKGVTIIRVKVDLLAMDLEPGQAATSRMRARLILRWEDPRLKWDKRAFRTASMTVDPKKIWTPDIAIFNRMDGSSPMLPLKSDAGTDAAVVSRDGTVKIETVVSAKIRCLGYLDRHLGLNGTTSESRSIWDEFDCEFLRIGSWVHNSGEVKYVADGRVGKEIFDSGGSVEIVRLDSPKEDENTLSFFGVFLLRFAIGRDDQRLYWNPNSEKE